MLHLIFVTYLTWCLKFRLEVFGMIFPTISIKCIQNSFRLLGKSKVEASATKIVI